LHHPLRLLALGRREVVASLDPPQLAAEATECPPPLPRRILASDRGVGYQCTPWGIPSYSIFDWQRPCYLMSDGYAKTYSELIETTDWSKYGRGNDPRCANCMAHCGYEPTAVLHSMSSLKESLRALVSR
jgi:Domain of unknown function (DUF3463)